MKKRLLLAPFLVLLVAALGCGLGKYSDVKSHIDDIIDYQYEYIKKLEKAEKGEEVAEAMDQYIDAMIRFNAEMKKLAVKYPELQKETVPPELQGHYNKLDETIMIVRSRVAGPLLRFGLEPVVLKAQKRMTEKMLKLSQESADKKEPEKK